MGEAAPVNTCIPQSYYPRKPQNSQYYQCVEDHFETFEQIYDERFSRQYGFFRPYAKEVIYQYPGLPEQSQGMLKQDLRPKYILLPVRTTSVRLSSPKSLILKSHHGMMITLILTTPLMPMFKKGIQGRQEGLA